MSKLTERALVKDLLQLPRADTRQDQILDTLIQTVSAECERICRRTFEYAENIVEYHPSYEQSFIDPDPQFLIVNSFPIDDSVNPVQIQWSPYDQRPNLFVVLSFDTGDFVYNKETGLISIRWMGVAATNLPFIGGIMFTYAPRGFQVTYTGGYPVTTAPSPNDNPDPLDDYGVTQVPDGLKLVVAKKVATNYRALRPDPKLAAKQGPNGKTAAQLAADEFLFDLIPYRKKDQFF